MSTAADFKAEGNKHLGNGNYEGAIAAYTKAIELNPNDHVFYSNRSAAYLSKNSAEEALRDAEKCIEVKPDWAKGYSRKGAALHALRNYEDAVSAYEDGLKIAPGDPGCQSGMDAAEKAMFSGGPGGPSSSFGGNGGGIFNPAMLSKLAAHPKFGPKLADPAFQMKLQMANTNPQMLMADPEMMELLQAIIGSGEGGFPGAGAGAGDSAGGMGGEPPAPPQPTKKAKPEINLTPEERSIKEVKDKALAAKDRGNAFYKEKKFDEALTAYDEAIAFDPENKIFISNKAAVYVEMKETDRARELCQAVLDSGGKLSFEDKGKFLARIASSYQKDNNIPKALEYYGMAQMENFDKAIDRKVKIIELEQKKRVVREYINPEEGQLAKERGNALFRESKFGEAVLEYEDAVKRDPDNAPLRNNLAAALVKIMDFNGAKLHIDKSLELDPKYVKAWAKKGDIEFFCKEYHKALESYKTGLAIDADSSLCREGLKKTMAKIQEGNSSGPDADRSARAMADPEIQQILQDMTIRQVLSDFEQNPAHAQKAMGDPTIRAKIDKLIAAGILQVK